MDQEASSSICIPSDRMALVSRSTARRYHIDEKARAKVQFMDIDAEVKELEEGVAHLQLGEARGITAPTMTPRQVETTASTRNIVLNDLAYLQTAFLHHSLTFSLSGRRLRFIYEPSSSVSYERYVLGDEKGSNAGHCGLHPSEPDNQPYLAYQTWLITTYESLLQLLPGVPTDIRESWESLSVQLAEEVNRLEDLKEMEWEAQSNGPRSAFNDIEDYEVGTDRFFAFQSRTWNKAVAPVYAQTLLAASMNVFYQLPRRATRVLLAGMRDTFRLTLEYARGSEPLTLQDERLLRFLARDPRTVLATFDLDPAVREYICCPSCFALYPLSAKSPSKCTYSSTPSSQPCGAKLFRKRNIREKSMKLPVRKYLHQSMRHWLGRMISREDIEMWLATPRTGQSDDPMRDIFDGLALRRFSAPGEQTPFLQAPPDELRLIFSLSVDGFNPFQMKEAKQSVTSTAIYMVCLNLPPHLRNRPENMYLVGVIPGPTKPSSEQINHFVSLLVDKLLLFWNPGVRYARTALRPLGRHVRAAMVPLVCDILAARQIAGMGAHNHTRMLCTCCGIAQEEIEDLQVTRPRDLDAHMTAARAWRDAESTHDREVLYRNTGVRWSELLRLGYWNPILYTVVDSMHNLYLGLLQRHIRDFWGIATDLEDGDASDRNSNKAPIRPSQKVMDDGLETLLYGSNTELANCTKPVLYHLCVDRNLRRAGTSRMLLRHLISWRNREGLPKQKPNSAVITSLPAPPETPPNPPFPSSQPSMSHTIMSSVTPFSPNTTPVWASSIDDATRTTSDAIPSAPLLDSVHNITVWHPKASTSADPPTSNNAAPSFSMHDAVVSEQVPKNIKLIGSGAVFLAKATNRQSLIRRGLPLLVDMCRLREINALGTRAILADRLLSWKQRRLREGRSLEPDAGIPVTDAAEDMDFPMPGAFPIAPTSSREAPPMVSSQSFQTIPTETPFNGLDERKLPPTAALGKNTLAEYVKDRSRMQLPSWVNPAPLAFGTSQHGKLSADQWRTLAVINLPITLIRTWGMETGRRLEMLKNFLYLVEAVSVLGYWEADKSSMARADELLQKYLNGVKELYKGGKIQPNHHLSLHLTMFIALFGPVHSWRSFAFERFNFMLQSLNINKNFGELEITFMMQSCRAANLRPIFHTDSVKKAMPSFVAAYEKLTEEDRRGVRMDDVARSTESIARIANGGKAQPSVLLDDQVYEAFWTRLKLEGEILERDRLLRPLSRSVVPANTLVISGVLYKPQKRSQGDSNVVFRHPSLASEEPGRIELIFKHWRTTSSTLVEDIFLAVKRLLPLSREDHAVDPYKDFPPVGGSLYYDDFSNNVLVVRPTDIVCHYAKTSMKGNKFSRMTTSDHGKALKIEKPCVHVLKLGKLLSASRPAILNGGESGNVDEREGSDTQMHLL